MFRLLRAVLALVSLFPVAVAVSPLWRLDVRRNEPVTDTPSPSVANDEARVFYLQGGYVKAVGAATGRPLWTFRVGSGAGLRYRSGRVLAVTARGKIYALEPTTGRVRWTRGEEAKTEHQIFAVADGTLYIAESEKLRALDLETGKPKWATDVPFFAPFEPFTVIKNRIFIFTVNGDAMDATTSMFDGRTGQFLGEADTYGPLAAVGGQIFFQDSFFPLDYPDDVFVNVHDLRTGKRLERRIYSVTDRVIRNYSSSEMAAGAGALYVSGGGNLACFPLSKQGGRAKPDFIRVPRGEVVWRAGPHRRTFVLEWRGSVWLVRAHRNRPCTPVDVHREGLRLGPGRVARATFTGHGVYVGLRNGLFYAADMRSSRVVRRFRLPAPAYGPSRVVGSTLVVQAGPELLAFALPRTLRSARR